MGTPLASGGGGGSGRVNQRAGGPPARTTSTTRIHVLFHNGRRGGLVEFMALLLAKRSPGAPRNLLPSAIPPESNDSMPAAAATGTRPVARTAAWSRRRAADGPHPHL